MENLTLTKPSRQRCADSRPTLESLISEWVAKLAVNAGAALDAKTQAVFCSIWLEGLGDLPPSVLLAAFRKTLKECAYWPVKVADIRKHVAQAESNATAEAAEQEWQRVLDIRRCYWNPDIPAPFNRAVAALPERTRRAALASGVFRDHESVEALHVWAKKKFIESFSRWDENDESLNLLPDGELKELLTGVAQAKALPSTEISFEELHARGLAYAQKLDCRGQDSRPEDAEHRRGPCSPVEREGHSESTKGNSQTRRVRC